MNKQLKVVPTAAQRFEQERVQASIEAEQNTLGCLLGSPFAMAKVIDILTPEHFYRDAHRSIYQAMLYLCQQEHTCNSINVADELERRGLLEEVGGLSYLRELENLPATVEGVDEHVYKVIRKAVMRNLTYAAGEIATMALHEEDNAVDRAMELVSQIAIGASTDSVEPFADVVDEFLMELRQRRMDVQNDVARGLPTGYPELDRLIGGLQPGAVYAVGALTGFGKSAFALNVALNIALMPPLAGQSKHILFCSLEMSKLEIIQRALSVRAEIDQSLLRDGTLSDVEMRAAEVAAQGMRHCDIKLDDRSYTINAICAKAKRLHAQKKLNLIVVDYLQLIDASAERKNTTRAEEVGEMSRQLKRLAQELNIPIIALVQLNRKVEERQDQEPKLADINESGGVGRNSDVVIFLYGKKEELEKREKSQAFAMTVKVAKARSGRLGEVNLLFAPRITKFREHTLETAYAETAEE